MLGCETSNLLTSDMALLLILTVCCCSQAQHNLEDSTRFILFLKTSRCLNGFPVPHFLYCSVRSVRSLQKLIHCCTGICKNTKPVSLIWKALTWDATEQSQCELRSWLDQNLLDHIWCTTTFSEWGSIHITPYWAAHAEMIILVPHAQLCTCLLYLLLLTLQNKRLFIDRPGCVYEIYSYRKMYKRRYCFTTLDGYFNYPPFKETLIKKKSWLHLHLILLD